MDEAEAGRRSWKKEVKMGGWEESVLSICRAWHCEIRSNESHVISHQKLDQFILAQVAPNYFRYPDLLRIAVKLQHFESTRCAYSSAAK